MRRKQDILTAPLSRIAAFALILACASFYAPTVFAADRVTLTLSSTDAFVGAPITVGIKIENAKKHDKPEFPDLPDCTVNYVGPSQFQSISIVNGRRESVETVTYNYYLTPQKVGAITIPGIPVHADGKTHITKPVVITVRDIPESPAATNDDNRSADGVEDRLLAEITCDEKQLYVGQTARFMLTIWIKAATYEGRPLSSSDMIGMVSLNSGPFDTQHSMSDTLERRRDDGAAALYYVVVMPAEVQIRQPGEVTFDEVSIAVDYPVKFKHNRSFGVFGGLRVIASDPIHIRPRVVSPEVLPLPEENRPSNFNGLVGRYEISAFATPSNVRVGDPIQLVIDVSGDPITGAPGPNLAADPELNDDFRVPVEELAGSLIEKGVKRFKQTIRAQRADVKYIPAIEYPFFDPEKGEYVVAKSEPIPVLVSVAEVLDASDLTDIAAESPQAQETQLDVLSGLRGNKTDLDEILAAKPKVDPTSIYIAVGAPPAVFLCILGVAALSRGRNDAAARRRRDALPQAQRKIKAASKSNLPAQRFHAEIEAALSEYLADRMNEPAARFIGEAAVAFLKERDVREDLVQLWSETIARCEQAAYAGGDQRDASVAENAQRCVRELAEVRL